MNIRPPNGIPVIGQQKAQRDAAVNQAVAKLTLDIYTRAASRRLEGGIDPDYLRELARNSQSAAQAFFEGLDIAQFKKPDSPS